MWNEITYPFPKFNGLWYPTGHLAFRSQILQSHGKYVWETLLFKMCVCNFCYIYMFYYFKGDWMSNLKNPHADYISFNIQCIHWKLKLETRQSDYWAFVTFRNDFTYELNVVDYGVYLIFGSEGGVMWIRNVDEKRHDYSLTKNAFTGYSMLNNKLLPWFLSVACKFLIVSIVWNIFCASDNCVPSS